MAEIGTKWIVGNFVVMLILLFIIYSMYASKTTKSGFEKVIDYSARRLEQSKFMKDPDLLAGMVAAKNQDTGESRRNSDEYGQTNEQMNED
jgi:ABC-type Na+ efflux pump permease subunit